MDRRVAAHLGISPGYFQKFRYGDHHTLPLDQPPDPPDGELKAFLDGMKLNCQRAWAGS